MAAKVDSLKDEMDEALNKVEICKVVFFFCFKFLHTRQSLLIRLGSHLNIFLRSEQRTPCDRSGPDKNMLSTLLGPGN